MSKRKRIVNRKLAPADFGLRSMSDGLGISVMTTER